ncbi:methyl-accepting chemotaxis protein [Paenibacillus sp. 3LSP]|uniref:methyl-accepting chemotaxis protein n=1 Tax=Paenibacillus sp. 3LSP TaxID=2800795 RepID=UPI0028FD233D|nr:methyl-accepting chemotaxis protein [Paenibacillus sp. 3LSP]MDU0328624.1 methyl-accepting chemotaxis protein [Paenibacillus sp. 3LSP]
MEKQKKSNGVGAGGHAFSLGRKLTAAFITVSLLVGVIAGVAYAFLNRMDQNYSELLEQNTAARDQAARLEMETQRQNSILFSYIVEPSAEKEQLLTGANDELNRIIGQIVSASEGEEQGAVASSLSESNATFARLLTKVRDYVQSGKPDLAKAEALMWAIPTSDTMIQGASELRTLQESALQAKLAEFKKESAITLWILVICGAIAILFAVLTGVLLSRQIVKPMRVMVKGARELADGDLTLAEIAVRNRDEIGELAAAFNHMRRSWQEMIRNLGRHAGRVATSADQLRHQSEQFRASSGEISDIMGQISSGSEEQVQSVELGVAQVTMMAAGAQEMASLADDAREESEAAVHETRAGEDIVAQAAAQMASIQRQMDELRAFIERLGVRSGQIAEAAELIAGIAKQTQMLSLNASIEAARAGEAGKGFAVVAGEVRKLSAETGAAAADVTEMLEGVRSEMELVIEAAQAGSQEVAAGIATVQQAGEVFSSIRQAVEQVAGQISRVTGQAEQLYSQSDAVVQAITTIDRVAQQTASDSREVYAHTEEQYAGVQEMMASMEGLSQLSEELQAMIGKFKV